MSESESIASALRETAIAWKRFLAAVDSIPADRVEESGVCGEWSSKTVIGHVGFWDDIEAERLGKGGEVAELDFQAMNDQNALESGDRTFAELRAELEINHARALAAIVACRSVLPASVRELLDDHYAEHGLQIEEWMSAS